jgi:hypothetical protein
MLARIIQESHGHDHFSSNEMMEVNWNQPLGKNAADARTPSHAN